MLIQYKVGNYKSIKDDIIINFTANHENNYSKWVNKSEVLSYNLFKVIGLVGPNASGKSNILDSLSFAVRFIKRTIQRNESTEINVEPFLLDENSIDENTFFEFIFIEDNVKYVYGFEVNKKTVDEEYLLAYYSKKPTTVFERTKGNKFDFKGNDIKLQTDISLKTNSNRLYLPVAAEWGYSKVASAYKWFNKMPEQYELKPQIIIDNMIQSNKKNLIIEALRKADINISDIYTKSKRMEKEQLDLINNFLRKLIKDYEPDIPEETPEIYITHNNKNGMDYSIPLDDDSSGTIEIIKSIAKIFYVNEKGGIIVEDELGKHYHTKLTQHIINFIDNESFNNIQVLFASHDTKILNILYPEQIYLVDKDDEGATFVKLLDDYCIREKDNIELGYLKGRYGAIPYTKD